MSMLHTVNKSPFEKTSLDSCLRFAREGASILLLEDGVYAAMRGTTAEEKMIAAGNRHRLVVLGPDLKARGLALETIPTTSGERSRVGPTIQLLNRFVAGLKELHVLRPVFSEA